MAQQLKDTLMVMMDEAQDDYFSCIICTQRFSDANPPLLFQCKHTFCQTCVKNNRHIKNYSTGYNLCVVDRTKSLKDAPEIKNAFFERCMQMIGEIRKKLELDTGDTYRMNINRTKENIARTEEEITVLCEQYDKMVYQKEKYEKYQQVEKPEGRTAVEKSIQVARENNQKIKKKIEETNQQISKTANDLESLRTSKQTMEDWYDPVPAQKRNKTGRQAKVVKNPEEGFQNAKAAQEIASKVRIGGNPFDMLDD